MDSGSLRPIKQLAQEILRNEERSLRDEIASVDEQIASCCVNLNDHSQNITRLKGKKQALLAG